MLSAHCGVPPAKWKPHRPCPDGHRPFVELSAINNWSVCRTCFDSSRGQNKAWQCISSKCVHQHIPYHVCDSKRYGARFSDHQSRISMRDGPKAKCATLISNEMHTQNTSKAPTSIMLNQEARDACTMQCNLSMQARLMQHDSAMHLICNRHTT
ncbi:hypothetical protein CsSME_00033961 [Camellia sinensis var. sinensis]